MSRYSLIEDEKGNYRYGYERFEEQETPPEPDDQKSTLRALMRDADAADRRMTLDELKARITAILPGATFEVDDLGQILIRSSFRVHIDSEALAEILRRKARDHVPPKKGRFRRN